MTQGIFDPGGDKTPRNLDRDFLKSRYSPLSLSYSKSSGDYYAPTQVSGTSTGVGARQATQSWGHPYKLLGKVSHNIGGQFLSSKVEISGGTDIGLIRVYPGKPTLHFAFDGKIYVNSQIPGLIKAAKRSSKEEEIYLATQIAVPSGSLMNQRGATAISRVAPTNPMVDLSTSMAELYREGLPSLPGRGGNAGGEYLNYQFGIAPLASDIAKLRDVSSRSADLLEQYERNSGRQIRRSYKFPVETSSTTSHNSFGVPVVPACDNGITISPASQLINAGPWSQTVTITNRTWFSGAFTYCLPASGLPRKMRELDYLYGVVPGVDTLYQLTPWSWLTDYFSNVGDVVENINSFSMDGLVMPYGYVMTESVKTTTTTARMSLWTGQPFIVSDTVRSTCKRRLGANPFGFGVLAEDLSPKQISILVALGISRM